MARKKGGKKKSKKGKAKKGQVGQPTQQQQQQEPHEEEVVVQKVEKEEQERVESVLPLEGDEGETVDHFAAAPGGGAAGVEADGGGDVAKEVEVVEEDEVTKEVDAIVAKWEENFNVPELPSWANAERVEVSEVDRELLQLMQVAESVQTWERAFLHAELEVGEKDNNRELFYLEMLKKNKGKSPEQLKAEVHARAAATAEKKRATLAGIVEAQQDVSAARDIMLSSYAQEVGKNESAQAQVEQMKGALFVLRRQYRLAVSAWQLQRSDCQRMQRSYTHLHKFAEVMKQNAASQVRTSATMRLVYADKLAHVETVMNAQAASTESTRERNIQLEDTMQKMQELMDVRKQHQEEVLRHAEAQEQAMHAQMLKAAQMMEKKDELIEALRESVATLEKREQAYREELQNNHAQVQEILTTQTQQMKENLTTAKEASQRALKAEKEKIELKKRLEKAQAMLMQVHLQTKNKDAEFAKKTKQLKSLAASLGDQCAQLREENAALRAQLGGDARSAPASSAVEKEEEEDQPE